MKFTHNEDLDNDPSRTCKWRIRKIYIKLWYLHVYTRPPQPPQPPPRPDSPIPYAYSCDAFFITVQQAANCPLFFQRTNF